MSFLELNLQQDFVASIAEAGYQSPTELQSQLIPLIANRKDVLVWSQTAAGKTGAFLIPAINYILANPVEEKRGARILILTSRRDRVSQINYTLKRLASNHNMRFGFVVSGRPYQPQMRLMRRPLDLMIATPGRLNDLIDNNKADFSKLEMLVVDDLTTIYHKNMQDLLNKILSQTGDDCPTVAFIRDDKEVTPYVRGLFPNAKEIKIAEEEKTNNVEKKKKIPNKKVVAKPQSKIELPKMPHIVHVADDYTHKIALMDHFLDEFAGEATIIHTSTLKSAEKLLDNLENHGHTAKLARGLSANEMQSPDNATLLISDQCKVTIPNNQAQHLLHFELPYKVNKYQDRLKRHQIKREEPAIILADGRDYNILKTIEKIIGNPLEQQVVPGLEALKPFVSQKPLGQKTNTNNKKPITNNNQNNRRKPQDNKANNKKRIRKGPHSRLEGGMGLRKKRNPLRRSTQSNDNSWQSDFAEPKERTVKTKRVIIRYKDSKKSLLK
ncbi:MAG: DEAD/DEAH box helicase [Cocleimonas sp.]|nr:DEAD/DEAH box helicase [Cocleimonas sp.]